MQYLNWLTDVTPTVTNGNMACFNLFVSNSIHLIFYEINKIEVYESIHDTYLCKY